MMPLIFLSVTVLTFLMGQLGRISFGNQQVNLYVYEIPLILYFVSLVVRYGMRPLRESVRKLDSVLLFFILFFASFVIKMPSYSSQQNMVAFLYLLRLGFYIVVLIYGFYHAAKEKKLKAPVSRLLLGFSTFILLTAIVQYLYYPDLRNLMYLGWDPHLFRVFGLFFDSSIAATVYGMLFIFFLSHSHIAKKYPWVRYLFLLLFLIILALTFARSAYIAFIMTLIYFLISRKKISRFLLIAGAFIAIVILIPKPWGESVNLMRRFSIESRIEDYQSAGKMWSTAPLLGVGYNRVRYVREKMNIIEKNSPSHAAASFHSSFLIMVVTGGVFGLIAFCYLMIQLAHLTPNAKYYMIYIAILSLADNVFLHPFTLFVLMLILMYERTHSSLE